MSERDEGDEHDEQDQNEEAREEEDGLPKSATAAKNELFAALGHLRNAAGILIGAADPAVRKVATDAEKALLKVGAEAEPVARQLGAELGKLTRSLVEVIEGKPERDDESEVERLERESRAAGQAKKEER